MGPAGPLACPCGLRASLCGLSKMGSWTSYVAAQDSKSNCSRREEVKPAKALAWKLPICSIDQIHHRAHPDTRRGDLTNTPMEAHKRIDCHLNLSQGASGPSPKPWCLTGSHVPLRLPLRASLFPVITSLQNKLQPPNCSLTSDLQEWPPA